MQHRKKTIHFLSFKSNKMQHSRKIQVFIFKQFNNLQIHPRKYKIGLEGLPLSCNPPVALLLALLVSSCSPSLLSLSLLALSLNTQQTIKNKMNPPL